MRKCFVFFLTLLICGAVIAQDPHFSQFFASPLTLNPAFTGKFDGSWRLAANHRDQWPSIPKASETPDRPTPKTSKSGIRFFKIGKSIEALEVT